MLLVWLNLWNLISINFGPLFVDDMISEYTAFKTHIQSTLNDDKANRLKRRRRSRSGQALGGGWDLESGVNKDDLCMLFDV